MKNYILTIIFTLLLAFGFVSGPLGVGAAHADLLTTVYHDYGLGAGKTDPGGTDALYSDYVQVSDSSSGRFYDLFNFSAGVTSPSIEYFELTLNFSDTDDYNYFLGFIPVPEDWQVRPGDSNTLLDMARVGSNVYEQTFRFYNDVDTFGDMVSSGQFYLWFADEAWGGNSFKLYDATLSVYGTDVAATPVPAGVWLLGSGLFGLIAVRRKVKS